MVKYKLPHCPHCGSKISFFNAWMKKTEGELRCIKCGKSSDIKYDKKINIIAITCEFIALIVAVFCLFLDNSSSLYGIAIVLLPFICFYIAVPFLMSLDFIKAKSRKNIMKKESFYETNVMDSRQFKNNFGKRNM